MILVCFTQHTKIHKNMQEPQEHASQNMFPILNLGLAYN